MKAIIVEIRKDKAALLSDDGCIVRVKNRNYTIGQEVEMNMRNNLSFSKITALVAACMMVFLGGSAYAYYTPTTYVSLDVNPAIEFSVNRFDRVLSAKGVNDEGNEILSEVELAHLKNKNIEEAITLTVNEIAQAGYLNGSGNGIVIATAAKNKEKAAELATDLETAANTACEKNNVEKVANAEAVGLERVTEAKELGVTPGKLNLVEKLIASAEEPATIDQTEWLTKPVKEIMAQTNQNKELERKHAVEQTENNTTADPAEEVTLGTENKPEGVGNGKVTTGSLPIKEGPTGSGTENKPEGVGNDKTTKVKGN